MDDIAKRKAVFEFLECYRSLPVLWDVNSPEYYKRQKKTDAYRKLLVKFKEIDSNATRESIVKKINSMRSAFRKELKKMKDAALADEVYKPTLWYFKELMFLVEQETSCPRTSVRCDEDETYLDDMIDEVQDDFDNQLHDDINDVTSATYLESSQIRLKSGSAENNSSTVVSTCHGEDEFFVMSRGFAYKLKKMAPLQRLYAERLVNEVLFEGQLGNLKRHSSINIDGAVCPVPDPSTSRNCNSADVPSALLSSCVIKQEYDLDMQNI